jgi:hypothetical protein
MDCAGPFRGSFTLEAAIRQDNRCRKLGCSWLAEINRLWNSTGPQHKMDNYEDSALWETILGPGTDGYINANYPGFAYVGEEDEFTESPISEDEDEDKEIHMSPPSPPKLKRPPTPFPTPCASPITAPRPVQPTSFLDYFSYPGSSDDDYQNFRHAEEAVCVSSVVNYVNNTQSTNDSSEVINSVSSRPSHVATPVPTPAPQPPPFSPTFKLAPHPVTVKAYHVTAKTVDPRLNRNGYSREDPIDTDDVVSPATPSPSSSNSSSDAEPRELTYYQGSLMPVVTAQAKYSGGLEQYYRRKLEKITRTANNGKFRYSPRPDFD